MNTVTGFVAIVSLLLALAGGGGTAKPQAASCGSCTTGNHNETLVRDTTPTE